MVCSLFFLNLGNAFRAKPEYVLRKNHGTEEKVHDEQRFFRRGKTVGFSMFFRILRQRNRNHTQSR